MLNGTAWNHRMATHALACGVFFTTHGKDLFLFFLHWKGNCEKWCLITKFAYYVRGMASLRQAVGNDMKKYSLHLIFTFYLKRVSLVLVIFPSVVFHQKQLFHADNHCATWECGFSVLGSPRPGPQLHNFPLKKPAVRPDVGRDQREPTMAYLNWGREPIQPAAVQNRKTSLTWKVQILLSISNSECLDE